MWNLPDDKWTNEYDDEAETLVNLYKTLRALLRFAWRNRRFPDAKRTFPDAET